MFLTGGGAGEGQPRLLLPGLRTGSLLADQGRRHGGGAQRVHAAATTAGHHMRPRDAAQALRGPGQAHRHHLQSFFPPEFPHIQHLLLDHLQSAAARGHPRKLVKGSQHFSFFVFYFFFFSSHSLLLLSEPKLPVGSTLKRRSCAKRHTCICFTAQNFVLRCVFRISALWIWGWSGLCLPLFSVSLWVRLDQLEKKEEKRNHKKYIYIYRCYL